MSAFTDWMNREHALTARAAAAEKKPGSFSLVRDAMEIAWDAALEAAARAQHPMLRDMIPRGKAADSCRALKSDAPSTERKS